MDIHTKHFKHIYTHWLLIVFLLAYGGLLLFRVVVEPSPFFDWDESIYMQVGTEMLQEGSLVPLWQGEPWLEKPLLVPFLYGVVATIFPGSPEVTTRVASVFISIGAMILLYRWFVIVVGHKWIALTALILAACNPIFYQRAHIVNADMLLLIGWVGYWLVFPRWWWGLFFVMIAVMSKSLVGYYPLIILGVFHAGMLAWFLIKTNSTLYRGWHDMLSLWGYVNTPPTNRFNTYTHTSTPIISKHKKNHAHALSILALHGAVASMWYVIMIVLYGKQFVQEHVADHLVKRVTHSIESHFGARTFYLDVVWEQYGILALVALSTLGYLVWRAYRDHTSLQDRLNAAWLVPWYLFLNLTKTKIHWYLFPVIPQIGLLIVFPLMFLRRNALALGIMCTMLVGSSVYTALVHDGLVDARYAEWSSLHEAALYVRDNCEDSMVLIQSQGRETFQELERMGLLISSSKRYGTHPSFIYYSGGKTLMAYSINDLHASVQHLSKPCVVVYADDQKTFSEKFSYTQIQAYDDIVIYHDVASVD